MTTLAALCACTTVSPTPAALRVASSPTAAATPLPSLPPPTPALVVPGTAAPTAGANQPAATDTSASTAIPETGLRQLTTGGCCVQPFWSRDSRQVRFIDRPSSGQPAGIWGVDLTGGAPVLVTTRLGLYSPDQTLVAYPEDGQTYIERVGGARWPIDNGGRAVIFSPDSTQIAWQVASSLYNFDRRRIQIWVGQSDGTGARKLTDLVGGGLAGWFPDGRQLLVTSRDGDLTSVQALNLADGRLSPLVSAPRLQGLSLSPEGGWLTYGVAFSGDASLDGLWLARINAGPVGALAASAARRLSVFGAFAWRGEGRLLVVPLDTSASSNRLLEVDAATGVARALTDPAVTPFQISQGDWALAPDGSHLAFVSAADHNIWVINLTE